MTKTALLVSLTFPLLGLLGCDRPAEGAPAGEAASGAETTEAAATEATASAPLGPRLSLLEVGTEPRRELRYQIADGLSEEVRIDLETALSTRVGDVTAEVEGVPTRFVFRVGPVRRLDAGRFSYQVSISDVEVALPADLDDESRRLVEETLHPLTTLSGWVEIDATGQVQQAALDVPAELNARTRTALGNVWVAMVSVPLPTEAVGVGGRWQVERTVELPHASVVQTTTYVVRAITDDRVELQMTMRQTAAPQPMRGLAEGESGRVEAYEATGLANLSVDLRRVAPRSQADVTTQIRGTLTSGGETVPLSIHLRTEVRASGGE